MSKPKIGIIVGSVRPNRFADKPTEWIAKIAGEHTDLDFEVVDLREGLEMVEEKARLELGMVKPNEILVQVAK